MQMVVSAERRIYFFGALLFLEGAVCHSLKIFPPKGFLGNVLSLSKLKTMSLAEMKEKAVTQIVSLTDEASVKEILMHLDNLVQKENEVTKLNAEALFDKAVTQYGDTLEKLAK